MKSAYALILACLPVISGCDQPESKPPGVLDKYGKIPVGSRIVVRLYSGDSGVSAGERKTQLLRATGSGEFEGNLVSMSNEEIVIQPAFSRSQVHFGASVVREIQMIRLPES